MKKILALTLAVLMLTFVFCSCGEKSFKCDMCEETKSGKSYTVEAAGEKGTVCEDCKKEWDAVMDIFGDIDLEDLEDSLGELEDSLGDLGDLVG